MILVPSDAMRVMVDTFLNLPERYARTTISIHPTTLLTTPWKETGPTENLPMIGPKVIWATIQTAAKTEMRAISLLSIFKAPLPPVCADTYFASESAPGR